jgi:predicted nucleotidyltransferase
MTTKHQILLLLERIERDHDIRILYACESGSRAWGFASPDSDYDIRFLFIRHASSYLSVREGVEAIDLPLEGDLDAGGWDLRKAARLLGRSNGPLCEWLHSPIVYLDLENFRERWQRTAHEVFSPRAGFDHYRGLAKQMLLNKLTSESVRAKDYLYALRAALCARWIAEGRGIPPVPFTEVLAVAPPEIVNLVPALLEHKTRTAEAERMDRFNKLDDFLNSFIHEAPQLHESEPKDAILDQMLRREIWRPRSLLRSSDFTLTRVRQSDLLLLDTVAGSQAYGTALAGSDEDRRGVFCAPPSFLGGLDTIEQVSDERSDQVYYEVGHFVSLLLKNNPNALELLAMPPDCVQAKHPLFDLLRPELFLSKQCARTFGEYAMGQIRKARGLNKKIVNPQPELRRPLLDFCRVPEGQGSVTVLEWLASRHLDPAGCALTAVQHTANLYGLYHGEGENNYRGLVSPKDPDALVFTSVPHDAVPIAWMWFHEDAFRAHCKNHREYWDWVGLRNQERFATNAAHGLGYDTKNLMHTLRLLDMAGEIARGEGLLVRRPNRGFLLRVRAGEFTYENLVEQAERTLEEVRRAFEKAELPEEPDGNVVNRLLVEIRSSMGEP